MKYGIRSFSEFKRHFSETVEAKHGISLVTFDPTTTFVDCSNSISAPEIGYTNWDRNPDKDMFYMGISGRLEFVGDTKDWVTIAEEECLLHLSNHRFIESTKKHLFNFKLFLDDFPDMKEQYEILKFRDSLITGKDHRVALQRLDELFR